ncbi:MAG: hypothetical protein PHP30_05320 [Bacteroidales bacterium]|nr:hypothetical protein [Bacteroidales bacterium]MDD3989501.1 hypothetical protein [Bacteroidales bacterium]
MKSHKRFRFKILPENQLIIENWSGEFNLKEILDFKNTELLEPEWNSSYNVLADDRDINIITDFINEDMNDYLPLSENFIKQRKTAVLTNSPSQVVAPTLMNLKKPSEALVNIEIFSTINAALAWLNIDPEESQKIYYILEELKED